jgi:threonine/homoserine/homoserine lactone efflux protein
VHELLAFLGVSAVVIVTPGPDTALTIRNTLLGGRRAGIATACGVSSGQAVWTLAASAGVAALIVASEPAFTAVKLLGAAYLVLLGAQSVWHALRGSGLAHRDVDPDEHAQSRLPGRAALRQGVISDLGNPKVAVFFTSLLPQFAPAGGSAFLTMLALGLLFCLLTFAWLVLYAAVVARAGDVLRRPRVRRVLDAVMGAVLVALGVRLAGERR